MIVIHTGAAETGAAGESLDRRILKHGRSNPTGRTLDRPDLADARGGRSGRVASRRRDSDPGGNGRYRTVGNSLPREQRALHDGPRPVQLGHGDAPASRRVVHPHRQGFGHGPLRRAALLHDVHDAGRQAGRMPSSAAGRAGWFDRDHHRSRRGNSCKRRQADRLRVARDLRDGTQTRAPDAGVSRGPAVHRAKRAT